MDIDEFEWDEANEEHVIRHGVDPDDVDWTLTGSRLIFRNKRDAAGDYLLVGRDRGGRLLSIAIVATSRLRIWRPITAWYCNEREARRARRHGL